MLGYSCSFPRCSLFFSCVRACVRVCVCVCVYLSVFVSLSVALSSFLSSVFLPLSSGHTVCVLVSTNLPTLLLSACMLSVVFVFLLCAFHYLLASMLSYLLRVLPNFSWRSLLVRFFVFVLHLAAFLHLSWPLSHTIAYPRTTYYRSLLLPNPLHEGG